MYDVVKSSLENLPEGSRLWVFPSKERLDAETQAQLGVTLQGFVEQWKAHGKGVVGAYGFEYERFVLVGASPTGAEVSGCSIDSMFRAVSEALSEKGLSAAEFTQVFILDGDSVRELTRSEFIAEALAGEITEQTLAFDTTLDSIDSYREGRWLLPVANSWHQQLIKKAS